MLRTVALHMRLGDNSFFSDQSASSNGNPGQQTWGYARERRYPFVRFRPTFVLQCLSLAIEEVSRPCYQAVVVSDNADFISCAQRRLPHALYTPGTAVHVGASMQSLVDRRNVDKIYLDWWLLASSNGGLRITDIESNSIRSAMSTFAGTAQSFRLATSHSAWVTVLHVPTSHAQAAVATGQVLLRACRLRRYSGSSMPI